MPSIRSSLINVILRNRQILKFSLKKETWDWNTSIPAFREECEKGARKVKLPEGIIASPVGIEGLATGLAAEWIRPSANARVKR